LLPFPKVLINRDMISKDCLFDPGNFPRLIWFLTSFSNNLTFWFPSLKQRSPIIISGTNLIQSSPFDKLLSPKPLSSALDWMNSPNWSARSSSSSLTSLYWSTTSLPQGICDDLSIKFCTEISGLSTIFQKNTPLLIKKRTIPLIV